MATITLYRQARFDGGLRTGIDVDGETILEHYQPESGDSNPALLWYMDVRLSGDQLPSDPLEARDWLAANSEFFRSQLERVAEENLEAGFDAELRPFRRRLGGCPEGCSAEVVISAVRRLEARDIADQVRSLAQHWCTVLEELAPLSQV